MPSVIKITDLVELNAAPADGDQIAIVDVSEPLDIDKTKRISTANYLSALIPKSLFTAVGQILYSTGIATLAALAKPSVDSLLKNNAAGTPVWKTLSDIVPGTTAGDIDYYTAAEVKTRLAKPAVDSVLKNTTAGVPSWKALSDIAPGTAAGDVDYYTASGVKTRLAKPSVDAILKNTTSGVLSWLDLSTITATLIHRRQGGSASDWNTGGSTTYTPSSNVKIQTGALTVNSNENSAVSITFPVAFTNKPMLFLSVESSNNDVSSVRIFATGVTNTGFGYYYFIAHSVGLHNITLTWMAIGE